MNLFMTMANFHFIVMYVMYSYSYSYSFRINNMKVKSKLKFINIMALNYKVMIKCELVLFIVLMCET
jgi:hypothetical protein